MVEHYEYRTAGRRTLTVAGWTVVLLLLGLMARGGATATIWTIWALVTAALVHHLLRHSVAGSRLDGIRWVTFIDRRRHSVLLRSIDHVTLCDCAGGRCACTVHLTDGKTLRIPACCLPPAATLAAKLKRQGVTVKRA